MEKFISMVATIAIAASLACIANAGALTPEALAAFQKAEIAKWWPIIKAANIKPE